ncbi:cytochrome P450 [Lipomyces oligophaga]|uniref:cytochrome P450 n=1 Tax=Lipomyces oligophaga TaxID=45792 RepID=UPI0034CEB6B8
MGNMGDVQRQSTPGVLQLKWIEANPGVPWIRFFSVLRMERLLVSNPAAAHGILMTHAYKFVKPKFLNAILERLVGNGLLSAEGDIHKRQRKLLNPAFSFGHIKELVPAFENVVWRLVKTVVAESKGSVTDSNGFSFVPIDHRLHESTLDVFFQALFGIDLNPIQNENHPLVKAYRTMFYPEDSTSFLSRLDFILTIAFGADSLPTPRTREVIQAKTVVREYCSQLLAECRQSISHGNKDHPSADHNLLNILVREGNGLSDQEIINNMSTFIAAGHETTSSAATFALHLLTKHPQIQVRLRNEIKTHLPFYNSDCLDALENPLHEATYEVIERMPFLNNVTREVLRLIPSVPVTGREAIEDVEIEGLLIRKGTLVFIYPAALNNLTSIWGPDAHEFNPDRWDSLPKTAQDPYSFETFLQGPRACIGRRFAELEFKSILIGLVGMFQIEEADPNRDYRINTVVTAKFTDPLVVKMKLL